jgi:hypothetical protein
MLIEYVRIRAAGQRMTDQQAARTGAYSFPFFLRRATPIPV